MPELIRPPSGKASFVSPPMMVDVFLSPPGPGGSKPGSAIRIGRLEEMVSFIVRMEFPEADRGQMEDLLRNLAEATRKEPGCVTFVPHFLKEGPSAILLYEQYVDEAALEHHRSSPHFERYATQGFRKLITSRNLEFLEAV